MPSIVHDVLREPGVPLDPSIQTEFSSRFEHDFGRVRIHSDHRAAESAASVNAVAYTVGSHIVFGKGTYQPSSRAGRSVLAHELTHVVQQSDSPTSLQTLRLDDPSGDALEREAERNASDISGSSDPTTLGQDNRASVRRQMILEQPAGGCGICQGPLAAGRDAHVLIQTEFEITYPLLMPEFPVPGGAVRPDLVMATPTGLKIGEIKPANAAGFLAGQTKINAYITAFRNAYPDQTIEPLDLVIPSEVGPFPNPMTPNCYQELFVNPPLDGVYGYWCEPPYSQLVGRPGCRCQSEKPVPDPLLSPNEAPEKKEDENKRKEPSQPQTQPVGVPAFDGGMEGILAFLKWLVRTGADVDEATRTFLTAHPELIEMVIGTAVASMVATIIEDFATAGVGLIDDPIILAICYRVIAIARVVKSSTMVPILAP